MASPDSKSPRLQVGVEVDELVAGQQPLVADQPGRQRRDVDVEPRLAELVPQLQPAAVEERLDFVDRRRCSAAAAARWPRAGSAGAAAAGRRRSSAPAASRTSGPARRPGRRGSSALARSIFARVGVEEEEDADGEAVLGLAGTWPGRSLSRLASSLKKACGIWQVRPAPSPASPQTPPRCSRALRAMRALWTTSAAGFPSLAATPPMPQASLPTSSVYRSCPERISARPWFIDRSFSTVEDLKDPAPPRPSRGRNNRTIVIAEGNYCKIRPGKNVRKGGPSARGEHFRVPSGPGPGRIWTAGAFVFGGSAIQVGWGRVPPGPRRRAVAKGRRRWVKVKSTSARTGRGAVEARRKSRPTSKRYTQPRPSV